MKPDWDKLMAEYKDHASILIGDVDCTTAGKPLCDANGVRGYPTIKSGDPADLQDYQGGRSLSDFQKHAKSLKPSCSPANIDLCDAEQKAKIEALDALSASDLDAKIKEKEAENAAAEKTFKDEVDKLQKRYEELSKEKDAALEAVKESGLGLMKAVKAAAKSKKDEL
jgi:hypothetical protein